MKRNNCEIRRVGDVIFVIGKGGMDVSALRATRRMIRGAMAVGAPEKVLVDLRRAELGLSWADWRALQAELPEDQPDWRMAFLVQERHKRGVWDYCRSMVADGHTRLVFTCEERARDWVGLEALPQPFALVA